MQDSIFIIMKTALLFQTHVITRKRVRRIWKFKKEIFYLVAATKLSGRNLFCLQFRKKSTASYPKRPTSRTVFKKRVINSEISKCCSNIFK